MIALARSLNAPRGALEVQILRTPLKSSPFGAEVAVVAHRRPMRQPSGRRRFAARAWRVAPALVVLFMVFTSTGQALLQDVAGLLGQRAAQTVTDGFPAPAPAQGALPREAGTGGPATSG